MVQGCIKTPTDKDLYIKKDLKGHKIKPNLPKANFVRGSLNLRFFIISKFTVCTQELEKN